MKYSTEYAAVLATFLAPLVGNYVSDACAGEVSGLMAGGVIAGLSSLYLLAKRYTRGGVSVLGVKS